MTWEGTEQCVSLKNMRVSNPVGLLDSTKIRVNFHVQLMLHTSECVVLWSHEFGGSFL